MASERDLEKGASWCHELSKEIDQTSFGLFCLTPESLQSQWLLFEAGAIAKGPGPKRVYTFLFDLEDKDVQWPLAQFQSTKNSKSEVLEMLLAINKHLPESLDLDILETSFERGWPALEDMLKQIPAMREGEEPKSRTELLLEEILLHVRQQSRALAEEQEADRILGRPTCRVSVLTASRMRLEGLTERSAEILVQFLSYSETASNPILRFHVEISFGTQVTEGINHQGFSQACIVTNRGSYPGRVNGFRIEFRDVECDWPTALRSSSARVQGIRVNASGVPAALGGNGALQVIVHVSSEHFRSVSDLARIGVVRSGLNVSLLHPTIGGYFKPSRIRPGTSLRRIATLRFTESFGGSFAETEDGNGVKLQAVFDGIPAGQRIRSTDKVRPRPTAIPR